MVMMMMMRWHLAGQTHRWWTPRNVTGSLWSVRFGSEVPTFLLCPRDSRVQREERGEKKKRKEERTLRPHR